MVVSLYYKPDFRVDVLRDRGSMGRYTSDGKIENVFNLKLENDTETAHDYSLKVTGLEHLTFSFAEDNGQHSSFSALQPFEKRNVVIEMQIPDGETRPGSHKILFEVTDLNTGETIREKSVFIVPVN